ncbi:MULTISPECIES: stress protein [unclassified Streptomyces]|uniref:stress protein n=1 Tax=unclassified Streptomyces TaxID=2593676 RepID=UPI0035DBCC0A
MKNNKRAAYAVISAIVAAGVLLPSTASYAASVAPVSPASSVSSVSSAPKPLASYATPAPVHVPGAGQVRAAGLAAPPKTQGFAVAVEVIVAVAGIAEKIYNITVDALARKQNRDGYVKSLMEGNFYEHNQRYNVMVINDANRYSMNLQGIVSNVKVTSDYGTYRVIVFESGTFTNHGDGGWINWGFKGWFDRNGGSVTFYRSW